MNPFLCFFLIIALSYWKEFLMTHEERPPVFIYQPDEKFHGMQETNLDLCKER